MSDGNQGGSKLKVVGQRPMRPDGVDKVTGRASSARTSICRAC